MWPVSQSFLSAVAGSHVAVVKATAYPPSASPVEALLADGRVRVDTSSAVRRELSATVVGAIVAGRTLTDAATLYDVLDTFGGELAVWRGIVYPNGREELCPVGRFRIDTVEDSLAVDGAVAVTGPDRMAAVVDDRFLSPRTSSGGLRSGDQLRRLLTESVPTASVIDESGATALVRAGVVWERERWDAVNDLATSIGCEVYADPAGDFRVRPVRSLAAPADWLVAAGPRGNLVDGKRSQTRQGVRNVIRAESSAADGTAPVFAVVGDNDPTSPTRVGGPFGRVPGFYASPLLTTAAQCTDAARGILVRQLGARGSLSLDAVVNPALEGGDRIDAYLPDGTLERHVADSFEVPLQVDGVMSITTRSAQDVADLS